jgi:hypothetical protein
LLKSSKTKFNTPVFSGRERHTHARPDNVGYPSRAIRTEQYLYVRNFKPDRWPAGNPAPFPDPKGILGYEDIDESPTKRQMMKRADQWPDLFQAGFGKKGEEELYDIKKDPACLVDLVMNNKFTTVKNQLRSDVPVGVLLSGGIDSSIVTCVANSLNSNIVNYTVDFGNNEEELNNAKIISNYYGCHHEIFHFKALDINKFDYII